VGGELRGFKESIREDFDRSTFNSVQNKLAKLNFTGALEKIEKLKSDELKLEAYVNTATDLALNAGLMQKYLKEFRFALEKYKEYIPGPEKGEMHFHNRIQHCELLSFDKPQEALALMDKITEDLSKFSDPYVKTRYLTRVSFKQVDIFQNPEKALAAARAAEKSVIQVESPAKRSELLINLIDKELSIFKDVKTAKRLIEYLEKTIGYINYKPDRNEQEASFRKVKNKHNLLLCEFEE
jgi:hypothetical protein